jgi:hypothetical protein
MRFLTRRCLAVAIVLWSQGVWALAPTIQSAWPPTFQVETSPSSHTLQLKGKDVTHPETTGFTYQADVQAFGRRAEGGWQGLSKMGGWSAGMVSVQVPADWLRSPGAMEFKLVVRGATSNVFRVPVVAAQKGAPQLESIIPARLPVSGAPVGKKQAASAGLGYGLLQVNGRNLGASPAVTVGGRDCPIGLSRPSDGYVRCWIPADVLARAGNYAVQIRTADGTSTSRNLEIVAPPQITGAQPEYVEPEQPGAAQVLLRLAGSQADRAELRARGGWQVASVSPAAGGVSAMIPASLRTPGVVLEVKLENIAGEATRRIPVCSRRGAGNPPDCPMFVQTPAQKAAVPSVPTAVPPVVNTARPSAAPQQVRPQAPTPGGLQQTSPLLLQQPARRGLAP